MKIIKLIATILLAIISFPLNWYAAYTSGTWFDVGASVIIPTYGLFLWLFNAMGIAFLQRGFCFSLEMIGGVFLGVVAVSMNRDDV